LLPSGYTSDFTYRFLANTLLYQTLFCITHQLQSLSPKLDRNDCDIHIKKTRTDGCNIHLIFKIFVQDIPNEIQFIAQLRY
jgi:hypothetical protein